MKIYDLCQTRLMIEIQKVLSRSEEALTIQEIASEIINRNEVAPESYTRAEVKKLQQRVWRHLKNLLELKEIDRESEKTELKTTIHKYKKREDET